MRKKFYTMFLITLLIVCSMLFVSCEAITAQNINTDSLGSGLGLGGLNAHPWMNGGPSRTRSSNMNLNNEMMNADLMGKIISVNGSSIELELIDQAKNSQPSPSNDVKQNTKDNKNNDNNNTQSSKDIQGEMPNINFTGTYKTITVSDDVDISQLGRMQRQNHNNASKSTLTLSSLKKNEIIMGWYKENTETVDKIIVAQS